MAKKPVFKGGKPLFIDSGGGVMRPAFADDPCTCCGETHNYCPCSCSQFISQVTEINVTISGLTDCTQATLCGNNVAILSAYNGSYTIPVPPNEITIHKLVATSDGIPGTGCTPTEAYLTKVNAGVYCRSSPTILAVDIIFWIDGAQGPTYSIGSVAWSTICSGAGPLICSGDFAVFSLSCPFPGYSVGTATATFTGPFTCPPP